MKSLVLDEKKSDAYNKDYVSTIRNAISHSTTKYTKISNTHCIIFEDKDPRDSAKWCNLTMKTSDVGEILEEMQSILLKYFESKYNL